MRVLPEKALRLNRLALLAAVALALGGCSTPRPDLEWSKNRTQKGLASWYSYPFHGKRTSNGEIYNMYAATAAHPSLPLNSIVEVTNDKNGRQVKLRINDRLPPNRKGRIIDLSKYAARELDMMVDGVVPVTLRVVEYGDNAYVRTNRSAPNGKMYLPGSPAPKPLSQRSGTSDDDES